MSTVSKESVRVMEKHVTIRQGILAIAKELVEAKQRCDIELEDMDPRDITYNGLVMERYMSEKFGTKLLDLLTASDETV